MNATPTMHCPDCRVELQAIKLVAPTSLGFRGEPAAHRELEYAALEATSTGRFLGRIPSLGFVCGFICPDCGRINFYGVGHESKTNVQL
ncbi:MAG: hypothetical protein ABJF10_22430 [Chthoniobacter sp.]|uniref:hypothetical protein n=1 Tax=Chthoniobacter sp. TaxID=2510640 RepID=UPI0032A3135E